MLSIILAIAMLGVVKPPSDAKAAATALQAMDAIASADAAIERACIKAWIAHDKLPDRPLPTLSDETNADMLARRAWVERACPGGDNP